MSPRLTNRVARQRLALEYESSICFPHRSSPLHPASNQSVGTDYTCKTHRVMFYNRRYFYICSRKHQRVGTVVCILSSRPWDVPLPPGLQVYTSSPCPETVGWVSVVYALLFIHQTLGMLLWGYQLSAATTIPFITKHAESKQETLICFLLCGFPSYPSFLAAAGLILFDILVSYPKNVILEL